MTQEEKAKAYDELLAKAKQIYNKENDVLIIHTIEDLFPQFSESEDERIRKELISFLHLPHPQFIGERKQEKWIAWLEKQCNQDNFSQVTCIKEVEDERIRKKLTNYFSNFHLQTFAGLDPKKILAWLEKQGEQKEINLVEILKHYPKETELYSPLYGKLWLAEVDEENEIITCYKHPLNKGCTRAILEQEDTVSFFSNGTTGLPDYTVSKDCMLFLYDIEQGKSALEAIKEEKVDGLIHDRTYNPADNVIEPKFHKGDWIVSDKNNVVRIKSINSNYYVLENTMKFNIDYVDKCWHLWSIQDAKDGDVLAFDNDTIVIFKDLYNSTTFHSYCHIEDGLFDVSKDDMPDWWEGKGFYPATKEQRDTLMKAMTDAGWEFDFEKKELKKIEQEQIVEPKFKVGDWAVSNLDGKARQISEVHFDEYNSYYVVEGKSVNLEEYDRLHHIWKIQDAKPGDVIYLPNGNNEYYIFVFKGIENAAVMSFAHFYHYNDGTYKVEGTIDGLSSINDVFRPATKEQRDLLFYKMHEAVYELDAEKKELKKIEQKPSWSEEDSPYYDDICEILINLLHSETTKVNKDIIQKDLNWLVSIKNRVIPQPKQEWSEEDEKMLTDTCIMLDWYKGNNWWTAQYIKDWLKSLKQKI